MRIPGTPRMDSRVAMVFGFFGGVSLVWIYAGIMASDIGDGPAVMPIA